MNPSEAELYNLHQDPDEQVNLTQQQPNISQQMWSKIETEMAQITLDGSTPDEEALLVDRLEQLGYL